MSGCLFESVIDRLDDDASWLFGVVDHGGCFSDIGRMGTPVVVALKPLFQPGTQLDDGGVFKEVDVLIFHTAPQPFDEDVVHPAAFAIHADFDPQFLQAIDPLCRGELTTLIRIEDLGDLASVGQSLVESLQAQACFHGVGDGPAKNFLRIPIHHGAEV